MARTILHALLVVLAGLRAFAQPPPSSVEVAMEPQKFGDVSSILKVDSTVVSFKFDQPVTYLALVLEAYPKEVQSIPLARLALDLTKPVTEGRLCVQMADQGFLPLGNGAPHQMQLFMQLDCGGTIISSSQSFLKEKFNFSRSLARSGAGILARKITGHRAPVFWLMGNSDKGTYLNDDDLEKMIAKNNRDAYVLIAYLETSKDRPVQTPELAEKTGESPKKIEAAAPSAPPRSASAAGTVLAFFGPPYPVPAKAEVKTSNTSNADTAASAKSSTRPSSSKSLSSSKKKKKRSS